MTVFITNPQERTRFLKFLVVGMVGAAVDFGIMNLFSKLFNMTLVWAGTISFVCAILSNYLWNRIWTYPDFAIETGNQATYHVLHGKCGWPCHPPADSPFS